MRATTGSDGPRRQAARRSWALRTLLLHVETADRCETCADGAQYPCLPVRIAHLYLGALPPARSAVRSPDPLPPDPRRGR